MNVTIPDRDESASSYAIDKYAFYQCNRLANIILPIGVTKIGDYAFAGCNGLGEFVIPNSVKQFSTTAFNDANVKLRIPSEDSSIAIILIDNEIPYTSTETGIKDSEDKYLNRSNTSYFSTYNTISSSGLVTLSAKYDFKDAYKGAVSNIRLKVRIPSYATLMADTVKVNGVKTDYSNNDNYLYINLTALSGTVTFSVKPNSTQYLMSYAQLEFKVNGSSKTETVGIVNLATKILTIDIPDETSKTNIVVCGVTQPGETVTIYVDGEKVGTCTASRIGNYSKAVTLKNPVDGKVYTIEARITETDGTVKKVTDFVTYNIETVKMTSCIMYYAGNEYNLLDINGKSPIVTWTGGSFTFRVTFENSNIIKDLYIVSTKNSEIVRLKAFYDRSADAFVAAGFDGYLPGTISVNYQTANNDYIARSTYSFDIQKEYNDLPAIIKDSNVVVTENNYDRQTDVGTVSSTITLADSEQTTIDYSFESKDVSKTNIAESTLVSDGFTKIRNSDNSYYYIKVSNTGTSAKVETVEYNIHGQVVRNMVEDYVVKKGVNYFLQIPSPLDDFIDVGKGFVEITGREFKTADTRKQIMAMNISDAEKQERIQALNKMNERATTVKLLSMLSTEVCIGLSIACPVAGLVLGFATSIVWAYMNTHMNNLYNDLTNNLLSVAFRFATDPSGFIYEAVMKNRISGVKTTAFFKTSEDDDPTLWDASEYEQMNPLYSDANGCYAWDVPEGMWQVKAEKDGYETAYSEWMPVPPPQLDVNIGIVSTAAPTVEFVNVYQDEAEIKFSQYMDIDSISSDKVTFTCGGQVVSGTIEAKDAELSYDGSTEYATTFSFLPDSDFSGDVGVGISGVKNYAGTVIENAFNETASVILRVQDLVVEKSMNLYYKESGTIELQANPASAAAGKKVSITLDNSYVAELTSTEVTLDANGKATITLNTLLPGDVDITYTVEDTTISKTTSLSVILAPVVAVEDITLDANSLQLEVGQSVTLKATITPETATDQSVTWASSDDAVASVSNNGTVVAHAVGNAVITATTLDGNLEAKCSVSVKAATVNLTGIAVKTMPTKTTYTVGESFDQSGLTLTASYSDGSEKTITTGFTCKGFDSTTEGEKTITVTYEGKTATFKVTVNPAPVVLTSIAVKTMPTKIAYTIGESFDQSGMTLTATYSDGSTKTITNGFTCSGFDSATEGTKAITVSYEGKTTTFAVTVNPAPITLTKITVKTAPTKTTYTVGESFDQSGLTLTATYSDGSTKTITSGFTCTGFSSASAGEKTITVTYDGKTATFTVTVVNKTPDPIIKIHNFTPSRTVDYRTTITFSVDELQNPVDGASVHWFINGQDKGASDSYTEKEAKATYTVQAKYMKGSTVLAESETETVNVKTGFFARLKAFFRALFGRLPKVVQEYLGIEIIEKVLP